MEESGKDEFLLINNWTVIERLLVIVHGRSLEECLEGE
jgi:hypothetical protein